MRLGYNKLGCYIREVNVRNVNLTVKKLLGISIQKVFIPSIANIIGTEMDTYKIIKKGQFAYGSVTSRNGDKISVALLDKYPEAIVSQAYIVFEVIDQNELLPEYLMMWFRRPEFDRYARFKSHGSARELFDWGEMCEVELPVPPVDIQREIVKEYHTLVDRIKLSEKINKKLEGISQAIFKQWFVDFDFPDENGNPYSSSSGEMVWCEQLELLIPDGWEATNISSVAHCNPSSLPKKHAFDSVLYLDTGNITDNGIDELKVFNIGEHELPSRARRTVVNNDIVFSTVRPNLKHFGIIKHPAENMIVSTGFAVLRPKANVCAELIYMTICTDTNLRQLQAKAEMSVSTYPSIKPEDLLDVPFILPSDEVLRKVDRVLVPIFELLNEKKKEINLLRQYLELLLQKLSTPQTLLNEVY